MDDLTVGMFGTCGKTTFRQDMFIPKFDEIGVKYFNPQVEDWDPSLAQIEAHHLANDEIVLFPITSATYGLGSLSEVGFSFVQAIKLNKDRDFVLLIDQHVDPELFIDDVEKKTSRDMAVESVKLRALVYNHVKKMRMNNVYLVNTLDEMLKLTVSLYTIKGMLMPLREKYNLHDD